MSDNPIEMLARMANNISYDKYIASNGNVYIPTVECTLAELMVYDLFMLTKVVLMIVWKDMLILMTI